MAKAAGMKHVYISTDHVGLYEKYGFEFLDTMKDWNGEDARAYGKHIHI